MEPILPCRGKKNCHSLTDCSKSMKYMPSQFWRSQRHHWTSLCCRWDSHLQILVIFNTKKAEGWFFLLLLFYSQISLVHALYTLYLFLVEDKSLKEKIWLTISHNLLLTNIYIFCKIPVTKMWMDCFLHCGNLPSWSQALSPPSHPHPPCCKIRWTC